MKPTFRKQYGSTRARDRVLSDPWAWTGFVPSPYPVRLSDELHARLVPIQRPSAAPASAECPLTYPVFDHATEAELERAFGIREPLPQHEATPDQMRDQWNEQMPQMRQAVVFDRKTSHPKKVESIAAMSERHALWLRHMAQSRPDAFALKQRLAAEAKQGGEPAPAAPINQTTSETEGV